MIGFSKNGVTIGVDYMLPLRKKPCLVYRVGNSEAKLGSFNNEESARLYMDLFADFIGQDRFDWKNSDDIPLGLMIDTDANNTNFASKVCDELGIEYKERKDGEPPHHTVNGLPIDIDNMFNENCCIENCGECENRFGCNMG